VVLRQGVEHARVRSLLEDGFRRLRDQCHLDFSYDDHDDDADIRQEVWLEDTAGAALVRLVNYRPISMLYLVFETLDDDDMRAVGSILDGLPIQTLAM